MTKLFASDFDGTLCLHLNSYDESYLRLGDLVAIQDFQRAGGLFGVCTGRPVHGITRHVQGVIPFDFFIAATGATLHDANEQLIWGATMDEAVVREMAERVGRLSVREIGPLYVGGDDYWHVGTYDEDWGGLLQAVPTFEDLPRPLIGWSMETATIEDAQRAADEVAAGWGDQATAFVNLSSIDVVPAGCSKGAGLLRAKEHFGATLTAGIGDSFNDLPLLQAADVAYTFAHAPAEMQEAADVIVADVAEALADFMAR